MARMSEPSSELLPARDIVGRDSLIELPRPGAQNPRSGPPGMIALLVEEDNGRDYLAPVLLLAGIWLLLASIALLVLFGRAQ